MKRLAPIIMLAVCTHASAINRCATPDGAVVFQDAPCLNGGRAITVKPAAGNAAPSRSSSSTSNQTEAQRIESNITRSQNERRLRDLRERELPNAESAVQKNLKTCEEEQRALEERKYRYVQNLYGKTDAAQAAAEQSAAAARCDLKDRELRAQVAKLQQECQRLGGCQ